MDKITVQKRDPAIKAKKLRRAGQVPGSVFGGSLTESISIQMDEPTATKLIQEKREGSRLTLVLDGELIPVQLKEKSLDCLTGKILHLGFQGLKAGQKVNSVIHIILTNDEMLPGLLEKLQLEVPYTSLPRHMVDTVTLDLGKMKVGDTITLADIPELQSENLELHLPADTPVVHLVDRSRIAVETEETAEEPAE